MRCASCLGPPVHRAGFPLLTSLAEHPPPPLALAGSGERAELRWALALAGLCALLLLAATAEIVLDGAVGHSPLIPKSPSIAGWLSGIGERLGYRVFLVALLAFSGGYVGLLALVGRRALRRLSPRWAIGLVVDLPEIVFAVKILLSTDHFSYIADV